MLLDPDTLAAVIPGAERVERTSETSFRAAVTLGVGPVTGRYLAEVRLSDLDPPRAVTLSGRMAGSLGSGGGSGRITLTARGDGGTVVAYSWDGFVAGKVASVGGRLLDGAARVIVSAFFAALARRAGGGTPDRVRDRAGDGVAAGSGLARGLGRVLGLLARLRR